MSAVVALAVTPGATHAQVPTPDYMATSNVKYIGNVPTVGDGVGAKVIGNYLYLTSTLGLWIYDVSTPTSPQLVSGINANVAWENEEVPTNGRILGISNSTGCDQQAMAPGATNCLDLYDVTDKAAPKLLSVVPGAGQHTNACVYDCRYFWGSTGAVTDATDPANAKLLCSWLDKSNKLPITSSHHVREIAPGYILTASQPILLLSVNPQDDANICHPKIIATGKNADARFIHSNRWPQHGTDPIVLIGGETNFRPQCGVEQPTGLSTSDDGAFMTWSTTDVYRNGQYQKGGQFRQLDEYRVHNGTWTNGGPPFNVLGCSVHWFEEHPSFHDGGLVALATYESGTRFLQVTPEGKIIERGYFIPVGRGSTSAPHWAPDGKTVYAIDYERGFDVLQWEGPTYVAGASPSAGAGSGGAVAGATARKGAASLPNTATATAAPIWPYLLLTLLVLLAGGGVMARRRRD